MDREVLRKKWLLLLRRLPCYNLGDGFVVIVLAAAAAAVACLLDCFVLLCFVANSRQCRNFHLLSTGMGTSLRWVQTTMRPSGDPQVENHSVNPPSTVCAALLFLGV